VSAAGSWLIRPVAATDLGRVAWLEAASFAEPWTEELLRAELAHPAALMLLAARAARAGGPAGGYACFRLAGGEAELLRVAVDPGLRGNGLGTALVAAGLERLRQAGARSCHLEVRPGNAGARAVYLRLGFAFAGRRPRYYRDGTDAEIFTLALAP
jgi:ribosomal-protein-alanine N-acetyltransferase